MSIEIDAGTPLEGDVDIAALVAAVPEAYRIRGMFFTPIVATLGHDLAPLLPRLSAAPPGGVYAGLASYPVRDFLWLFDAAARKSYPGCAGRQAHRLRAREQVKVFASSIAGRAALSVITDPATALLRYPEIFGIFVHGPRGTARRAGPTSVTINLTDYYGSVEYTLGVLEGLVQSFGHTSRTLMVAEPKGRLSFFIRWS